MKKILTVALAMIMMLGLCACGASDAEKAMYGTYKLYAMDYDENTTIIAEGLMEGENYVALKSGGDAEMCLENEKANIKWKADGSKVTLSAADGDMDATVSEGILTLVMDDTKLYYVMEGASTDSINAITLDDLLNGVIDDAFGEAFDEIGSTETNASANETEVQKMWGGWWYGAIDINACTNNWEWINNMTYDMVMNVQLDEDGYGTMDCYDLYNQFTVGDWDQHFASVACHADTMYLYADSGQAFGYDIKPSDWTFVHNLANADKINAGSAFEDSTKSRFGYDFTLMRWGSRWEGEDYSRFIPNFNTYLESIDAGMTNPFESTSANTPANESPAENENAGENKSTEGNETPSAAGGSDNSGNAALLGSNPVKLSVDNRDIVFVYYPGDQFEYNSDYGKIKSTTGSAGILFDPMLGETNFEELKASYEANNSKEEDYSLTETTVNGYKAQILKYTDWLNSTMRVDVDFGGNHDGYYGISFCVSADSLAECDTDLIWAIINSFELAK